jgi:hypothetical protein
MLHSRIVNVSEALKYVPRWIFIVFITAVQFLKIEDSARSFDHYETGVQPNTYNLT